jgi:hypothetical protein
VATARLNLLSIPSLDVAHAELVVAPPAWVEGVPELHVGVSVVGTFETFPALPPVVHVSGTVLSTDRTPVSATLLFVSSELDDAATCANRPKGASGRTDLFYQATVQTIDQLSQGGAVGSFEVSLPQGSYSVVVDPSPSSGYAKSTYQYLSAFVVDEPLCSGASPTLVGVEVPAIQPVNVSGAFITADGRPLANASVDFTPASALAPSRNASPAAVAGWPRAYTTTTDVHGGFSIAVDPYARYDMTVRPQDGTAFPWVVRPDRTFTAGELPLEPVVVPAPFFLSMTLHDPYDTALSGATVQAFSFWHGSAVAIGEALTDDTGHFTMMLTTSFPAD